MSSRAPAGGLGSALARAAEAHALVQARPHEALALATQALEAAVAEKDAKAQVAALHAHAWASLVLGDVEATGASLKAGIRIAERTGNREGAAGLRRLRAGWLADAGKTAAARREIDAAVRLVTGPRACARSGAPARHQHHRADRRPGSPSPAHLRRSARAAHPPAKRRLDLGGTAALQPRQPPPRARRVRTGRTRPASGTRALRSHRCGRRGCEHGGRSGEAPARSRRRRLVSEDTRRTG